MLMVTMRELVITLVTDIIHILLDTTMLLDIILDQEINPKDRVLAQAKVPDLLVHQDLLQLRVIIWATTQIILIILQ